MARRRLIRKQPLWEKITSYPFDFILSVNETRLSIDWDDYIPKSLPIGTGVCHVFLIFCKLSHRYQASSDRRVNSVFRTDVHTYQLVMARAVNGKFASDSDPVTDYGSPFGHSRTNNGNFLLILNVLMISIAAASLINVLTVVFSYRSYSLLNLHAKLPKPNASNVVRQNLVHGPQKGLFLNVLSYFEEHSYYETDLETDDSHPDPYPDKYNEKPIWFIKVWDPSPFSLYLACSFSPVILLTIWLISSFVSFWRISLLLIVTNVSAFSIIYRFFQLVSDKQIIYQETFNEYNRKYVIPKTCVLKKNALVDATCGPMALPDDIVHDDIVGHLQKENVFVTHDLLGRRHRTVRADMLARLNEESVNRSPSRNRNHDVFMPNPISRGIPGDGNRFNYDDSIGHYNSIAQSTPYRRCGPNDSYVQKNTFSRNYDTFSRGFDSFSRQSSQIQSPIRSPTRFPQRTNLSFDQRAQLSPSRSSRQPSPQRSPSPSKRPWH